MNAFRALTSTSILAAATVAYAACGGRATPVPVPSTPEMAVRTFLDAAAAEDLRTMGGLWGGARGPASTYMDGDELEKRLTVIRIYLTHEQYEILSGGRTTSPQGSAVVRVRLHRNGCDPVVPFTLIPYRSGWLINNVDVAAAGNPEQQCPGTG